MGSYFWSLIIPFSGNSHVFVCRDIDVFDYRVLPQPLMLMLHNIHRYNLSKSWKILKVELFLTPSTWDKVLWICSPFIWPAFITFSPGIPSAALWDLLPIRPCMQHQSTGLSILPSWPMSLPSPLLALIGNEHLDFSHPSLGQGRTQQMLPITHPPSISLHKTHPLSPFWH